MTAVILIMLKIIGVLLLALAGLAFVLLLLVLVVPVRYRLEASYYGKPEGGAVVSWLLHFLSVRARYQGELRMAVRVLGFRVFDTAAAPEDGEPRQKIPGGGEHGRKRKNKMAKAPRGESEERKMDQALSPKACPEPDEKKHPFSPGAFFGRQKEKLLRILGGIQEKTMGLARACRGKIQLIQDKKAWLQDFWNNEKNRKTLRLLKRQACKVLRHILPKKLRGHIRFGFDDPYKTGQILTYLSPFYGWYAGKLEIIPVFGEQVLEGEASLVGRMRVGVLLGSAARMLLDKNFRRLVRQFRDRK